MDAIRSPIGSGILLTSDNCLKSQSDIELRPVTCLGRLMRTHRQHNPGGCYQSGGGHHCWGPVSKEGRTLALPFSQRSEIAALKWNIYGIFKLNISSTCAKYVNKDEQFCKCNTIRSITYRCKPLTRIIKVQSTVLRML